MIGEPLSSSAKGSYYTAEVPCDWHSWKHLCVLAGGDREALLYTGMFNFCPTFCMSLHISELV
jgi:hypothetical protein